MQLRDYQLDAVDHVRSLRGQNRVCLEAPTGAGKTAIMADLLADPRRQLVLTHRRILLDQLSATLTQMGVPHTFRAAGYRYDPKCPVAIAMIQTELRRKRAADVDVVHTDEIHCFRGPVHRQVFSDYLKQGASIIGYTATPSDIGDLVDDVYRVATVPDLIEQSYLCPPRVYGCGQPDMRKVERLRRDKQGEYLAGDVDKLVQPRVIFGSVLEHYRRLNNGTPFVLFAHSVQASVFWAQSMTAKGVPTAHIDGNDVWVDWEFHPSDSEKRAEVFKRLADGDLKGVCNRFVLREGWNETSVGHAILTCPMALRKTWVQACGRVLRPHPGKDFAVIQDHSGSCINHPPLDSDEPWDWAAAPGMAEKIRIARMREDEIPEPIICPQCMGARHAGDTCPYCGYRCTKRARYVYETDGSLRLINGKSYRPRKTKPATPADVRRWERAYYAAKKNSSTRTFEQAIAYDAYRNNWQWLPRDLPFMPRFAGDWFLPVSAVPKERLIPKRDS